MYLFTYLLIAYHDTIKVLGLGILVLKERRKIRETHGYYSVVSALITPH